MVEASADDATAVVTVIDSGSGVDESDLERMLLPECQGSGDVGESGLGLWIVAELVDDLGGSVRVTTGDGSGLAVSVEIPIAE